MQLVTLLVANDCEYTTTAEWSITTQSRSAVISLLGCALLVLQVSTHTTVHTFSI